MAEVQGKRFRFGLRSFLLGFTLLAVWFSYRTARQLRAEEMARHHWAIVSQLIESADSLPSGATFAQKVNSP